MQQGEPSGRLRGKAIEALVTKVLEDQFAALVPDERTWYGEETLKALLAQREEYKQLHKNGRLSVAEYLEFRVRSRSCTAPGS